MPARFSKMLSSSEINSDNGSKNENGNKQSDITHIHYISKPHDPQISMLSATQSTDSSKTD